MRVPVNLASEPYENLRPLYSAVVMGLLLLIVLSLAVAWKAQQSRNETRVLAEQSEQLDKDLAMLRREQQELMLWLGRPEVQEIREHATFLNSLITRKSLSWTQMFMDLEQILPNNVQVTAIRPSHNESAQAELNLTVVSPTVPPLLEFLKNLEGSPQFSDAVVESQRFPVERATDPNIVLELNVAYRQSGEHAEPSGESREEAAEPAAGLNDTLASSPSGQRKEPR